MNTGNIGLEVLQLLSPVFLAALTWAASKLAQLIRAKVKNEDLKGALLRLDDAVLSTVKDLQQTLVEQLKAARADGRITEAEKQQLKNKALAAAKASLGTAGRAEVAKAFGLDADAFDALLSSKLAAAVHDLRRTAPPSGTAAPAAETLLTEVAAA